MEGPVEVCWQSSWLPVEGLQLQPAPWAELSLIDILLTAHKGAVKPLVQHLPAAEMALSASQGAQPGMPLLQMQLGPVLD